MHQLRPFNPISTLAEHESALYVDKNSSCLYHLLFNTAGLYGKSSIDVLFTIKNYNLRTYWEKY